ncbi:unnamed protein product [Linum trigynum]|uniref:Uncharacterized protein n=1 Tax=Linum trigynum TaxID=586398 RepID=A0AAV2EAV2_9ROSI
MLFRPRIPFCLVVVGTAICCLSTAAGTSPGSWTRWGFFMGMAAKAVALPGTMLADDLLLILLLICAHSCISAALSPVKLR